MINLNPKLLPALTPSHKGMKRLLMRPLPRRALLERDRPLQRGLSGLHCEYGPLRPWNDVRDALLRRHRYQSRAERGRLEVPGSLGDLPMAELLTKS